MPDNINEPNSNILDALQGNYSQPQDNIQEPQSPILQAILSGGGGGTPADYGDIKKQVETNKQNIEILATALGIELGIVYETLQDNQAVKLSNANSIDTGLFMDGNAEFEVKGGVVMAGAQAILVGAYNSNSERTALKFLTASQKIQSQWATNVEITELNGLDLNQPISYVQNKDETVISQNEVTLNVINGGFIGVSDTNKIYLFNQTESGVYNGGFLFYAKIKHGGTVYEFNPMRKIKNGVDLGIVMLKNGEEIDLKGGVLELVDFN